MSTVVTEQLPQWLAAVAEADAATIEKLRANLLTNPARALEWSHKCFEAAARMEVCTMAQYYITTYKGDDDARAAYLQARVREEMQRRASTLPSSNSAASNLMDDFRRVVWARMNECLKYLDQDYFSTYL
jgi:hypothetical protein